MNKFHTALWVLLHLVALLVGVLLITGTTSTLWESIGASLVAGAGMGILLVGYVYLTQSTQERLESLRASGIVQVFTNRSAPIKEEYTKRLAGVREKIDILGFGLHTLLKDMQDDFKIWERQAEVRILLLDPEFPTADHGYAQQRDAEEGDPAGTIAGHVKAFAQRVAPLLRARGGRFQVRLYTAAPSINYFRIDDEAFWGPYLVDSASRNLPTLLVDRSGVLFGPLSRHFESLWTDHSREIPKAWQAT